MVLMTFTVTTKDVLAPEGEETSQSPLERACTKDQHDDDEAENGEEISQHDDDEAENGESEELAQTSDEESLQT